MGQELFLLSKGNHSQTGPSGYGGDDVEQHIRDHMNQHECHAWQQVAEPCRSLAEEAMTANMLCTLATDSILAGSGAGSPGMRSRRMSVMDMHQLEICLRRRDLGNRSREALNMSRVLSASDSHYLMSLEDFASVISKKGVLLEIYRKLDRWVWFLGSTLTTSWTSSLETVTRIGRSFSEAYMAYRIQQDSERGRTTISPPRETSNSSGSNGKQGGDDETPSANKTTFLDVIMSLGGKSGGSRVSSLESLFHGHHETNRHFLRSFHRRAARTRRQRRSSSSRKDGDAETGEHQQGKVSLDDFISLKEHGAPAKQLGQERVKRVHVRPLTHTSDSY